MTVTIAILNQKGGVGKTTVTLGLASALRARRKITLVVDLDPQQSSTWALGVDPGSYETDVSTAMELNRDGAAANAIYETPWGPLVDVLPSSPDLTERDTETARTNPQDRLRRALAGITDPYDVVLIDCPPSLGLNSRSALVAADYVLLVTEPSALGTQGLAAATEFIDEVWHAHNRKLDVAGIVVNRVPPVSSEAEHRYDELATMVGRRAIWKPAIPQRVVVGRAIGERRPIHDLGWRSSGVSEVFDAHAAKLLRLAQ
jgi:chromosome partitioning protein